MKKILLVICVALFSGITQAQQREGKVIYERTTTLNITLSDPSMANMIPKSRTEKLELNFANNQSLWKQAPKEIEDEPMSGSGMQIRFSSGSDNVLYYNFDEGTSVEKRELFDKTFIIDDSIRKMKWKITGETKMISGHNCSEAVATRYGKRSMMSMANGTTERKEVNDTTNIIAWFAMDIPVSAGPAEYAGQLPGLILEMNINNGRQIIKAVSILDKADLASIVAPKGKKRYTPDEFKAEQKKMMDQMQKNGNGGSVRIISQ
jgi:GLPGLI family protein